MPQPLRIALLTAICCAPMLERPACAQTWVDRRISGPFDCHAEFSLESYEGLLDELSGLQRDLTELLGVPPAQEPIRLYLFRDRSSYDQFFKQHLPGIPYRRALYMKGKGPGIVYVYRSKEMVTDIRHEGTHALLHAVLPMVPLWLDEGLAEYFEVSPTKQAFDNPHHSKIRWNLRFGSVPSLEELERLTTLDEMRRPHYRDAWGWVHFMLHGPKAARGELVAYLACIRSKTPPGLLSQRLSARFQSPRQAFSYHFKHFKR